MGLGRRLDRFLRPPGRVPHGGRWQQAHLARWWRWYGVAALGLLLGCVVLLVVGALDWGAALGTFGLILGFSALGGWRITHPPPQD